MTVPVALSDPASSGAKSVLKRAWAGFLAAATSSVAVKEEKNIAVTIVTGVLLSIGASAGLVQLATSIIQGL